ncbi:MAG TPA: 1,2-phenylacetyl-CoA epoxidase subunit PaaE [Solirubrobacterales bacterium]|nr:1,2-phenylacetyl-CoA epoxidase subunit PaaE [Solirubrobacterales bacterium]
MRFHALTVADVERLTEDSLAVTFAVPEELREEFEFTPGQHLVMERDGMRRTYSICVPAGSGVLRVAIRHLPGGAFSTWAHEELRTGDALEVMAPGGSFTVSLDPAQRKRYAAIAAGSGITPILSIVATVLEREPLSRVALVYANRTSATTMFLEELQDLKDTYPERLELIHVFSREPQAVELFSGRLDAARLERIFATLLPPEEVDDWFLCGPLELIETCRQQLLGHDVAAERIHREIFHAEGATPAPPPVRESGQASGSASVVVTLDGRESTIPVAHDGAPILDALLAVRGDAPYACKGGVCGTCRARVLEGEVRMDFDYALERGEIEQGYVLACQSHPLSERVVLDFDQ